MVFYIIHVVAKMDMNQPAMNAGSVAKGHAALKSRYMQALCKAFLLNTKCSSV
jgi:hypothetical protein